MTQTKRHNWFVNYQEMPDGRSGKRRLDDRAGGFDMRDFQGKTVLDLGCNLGQMSLYAAECGARRVVGVEYDRAASNEARGIRNALNRSQVVYKLDDLDNPLCWHGLEPHDTVLLLSVIDTKELTNRFGILSRACMKCKEVLYLEGHRGQPRSKYMGYLLDNTDFTQIEHVGTYEGRDLFRCSRNILDTNGFYHKLGEVSETHDTIGVIGNRHAGKSTLCSGVEQPGFTVLDDCDGLRRILECDRLILFDYRAGDYTGGVEVLFHVLQPPSKWESFRKYAVPSPATGPLDSLRCVYTVRTH